MKRKTKVAVLLYGQPRFVKENIESIKNEFTFHEKDNVEVDFFCHFWSEVGYNTTDDYNQSYHGFDDEELVRDTLKPKALITESQMELRGICEHIASYINSIGGASGLQGDPNTHKTIFTATDYKGIIPIVGQTTSIERVAEALGKYEDETQTKYDIVIRTRTDLKFIPQSMYKNSSRYWSDKYNTYIATCLGGKKGIYSVGGVQYWGPPERGEDGRIYPEVTGLRNIEFSDKGKSMTILSKAKNTISPSTDTHVIHLKDWLFFGDSDSIKEHSKHLLFRWLKYSHDEMSSYLQGNLVYEWGAMELVNGMQAVDKKISIYSVLLDDVDFWDRWIKIQAKGKEKELHIKQRDPKNEGAVSAVSVWYNEKDSMAVFLKNLEERQKKHVNPDFLKCRTSV